MASPSDSPIKVGPAYFLSSTPTGGIPFILSHVSRNIGSDMDEALVWRKSGEEVNDIASRMPEIAALDLQLALAERMNDRIILAAPHPLHTSAAARELVFCTMQIYHETHITRQAQTVANAGHKRLGLEPPSHHNLHEAQFIKIDAAIDNIISGAAWNRAQEILAEPESIARRQNAAPTLRSQGRPMLHCDLLVHGSTLRNLDNNHVAEENDQPTDGFKERARVTFTRGYSPHTFDVVSSDFDDPGSPNPVAGLVTRLKDAVASFLAPSSGAGTGKKSVNENRDDRDPGESSVEFDVQSEARAHSITETLIQVLRPIEDHARLVNQDHVEAAAYAIALSDVVLCNIELLDSPSMVTDILGQKIMHLDRRGRTASLVINHHLRNQAILDEFYNFVTLLFPNNPALVNPLDPALFRARIRQFLVVGLVDECPALIVLRVRRFFQQLKHVLDQVDAAKLRLASDQHRKLLVIAIQDMREHLAGIELSAVYGILAGNADYHHMALRASACKDGQRAELLFVKAIRLNYCCFNIRCTRSLTSTILDAAQSIWRRIVTVRNVLPRDQLVVEIMGVKIRHKFVCLYVAVYLLKCRKQHLYEDYMLDIFGSNAYLAHYTCRPYCIF
uniref:Uncharacterized protein n=1 Tax=Mycena chlorophos TaxID=658473 RepID=A0ABQ0LBM5_MYCCL|nr:predicted protein [Mycena chlorophos]